MCCPAHNDRHPSLLVGDKDDGSDIWIKCETGCTDDLETWKQIKDDLKGDTYSEYKIEEDYQKSIKTAAQRIQEAREKWHSAVSLLNTSGEQYLSQTRQIFSWHSPSLRFHHALWHPKTNTYHPCLLAAICRWPDKNPVAVQATYLDAKTNRKLNEKVCRITTGPMRGGAVRLAPISDNTLIIGEGVETVLSAKQVLEEQNYISTAGAWAALSASNIKSVGVPDSVAHIIIAADVDAAGRQAAISAKELWGARGISVDIVSPPAPHKDFNDILMNGGHR